MQLSKSEQTVLHPQSQQLLTFFTDPLLLSYITQFLNVREQLAISTLSKRLRFIMEDYFKGILHENRLHLIPGKSSIHQMHFYFNRCLRIFRYQKQSEAVEVKLTKLRKESVDVEPERQVMTRTIQVPFKFTVIQDFQVGPVYTACLTRNNHANIFRTNQLLSLLESKDNPLFCQQHEVEDITCKSDKLIMTKTNGEVFLWETDKKLMAIKEKQTLIPWTSELPVKHVYSSYTYALFQLQHPYQSKQYLLSRIFGYQLDKNHQQDTQYYMIALNLSTNIYYLVKVQAERLLSVAIGHKQAYLVNEKYECLTVEFDVNEGTTELKAKLYQPMMDKKIVKVASGYTFYLALERNIQEIQQWSVEEVAIWLKGIGFADYVKIAVSEKLDGLKLKAIERKFMENVLGITKLNMQQKLILCIEEVLEGRNECDQLWGWGKNQFGQLGVTHANYIAQPIRIKLDFLQGKDRVDSIFCGWQQTYIRTHRGRIYSTLITSERKKKKATEEKDEKEVLLFNQEEGKIEESNQYKNKKRKKTEDFKGDDIKKTKVHHKRFENEQRWVESPAGKAFFVQAFKDYSFYIQCPNQSHFQPTKQKKLRPSKAIIDRILWDTSLDKSEFRIGITDKEMGTIEVSPLQIQTFDYKQTSIRYVKRNGIVVWDRESKIDHL